MDSKEIKELLNYIINTGLDEVYIKTDNITIKTKKTPSNSVTYDSKVSVEDVNNINQSKLGLSNLEEKENTKYNISEINSKEEIIFKSPMIGTFYGSANPDSAPFVQVGDIVSKGQTLCIIEAMKLFNEIESDISGKIVKILVEESSPVEFDQPLFVIEPQ